MAVDIGSYTAAQKLEGILADAVLVSHLHGDHLSVENIKKLSPNKLYLSAECMEVLGEEKISSEIAQIRADEVVNIGDIKVQIFNVDHGPNTKVRPKENFGFLLEVDGQKIYFAGDMFYPSGIEVADLEVDIVLLPVGGFYTFGPVEAIEFSQKFKKIGQVLPMHYEKAEETKEEFLKLIK